MKGFLKTAPAPLVQAYEKRTVNTGRQLLGQLLGDERMRTTWQYLARKKPNDVPWMRIWAAIAHARNQSKKAGRSFQRRSDLRNDYQRIGRLFARLAKKIKNTTLDVPAYELFPPDTMVVLKAQDLHKLDVLERSKAAHELLADWPGASELLLSLKELAKQHAKQAMESQLPDERKSKGNPQARIFVWYLGHEFTQIFGEPLLGSLANIASVVFNEDITKSYAQKALFQGVSQKNEKS